MNFDDNNKAPGWRSLSLSNRAPDEDAQRAPLDAERVLPTTITDLAINPGDVLCGRGKLSFNHTGNKRFRDLVGGAVTAYNEAESRLAKAAVVNSLVEEVRSSGGRFLRRDEEAGKWHVLSHAQCREKVGHAIRDATASIEARKKRQRLQEAARQSFVSTLLAKPPASSTCYSVDKAGMSVAIPMLNTNIAATTCEQSPAFLLECEKAAMPQKSVGSELELQQPSYNFLQGFQQQASTLPQAPRALPRRTSNPSNLISNGSPGTGVPIQLQESTRAKTKNDDEQFLAYIEEVLGPLSPSSYIEEVLSPSHPQARKWW